MPAFIPDILAAIAMVGVAYNLAGAALAGRWRDTPAKRPAATPSITMLKPLYGPEPELAVKLSGFLDQDYDGPIAMVCGVSRADDPALAAVPATARTVIDPARHGSNAKVSNLINMMREVDGEIVILSDSDMSVPRDYAARIAAALEEPGVGAVTLLYSGRGETNGWSRMAAAGISWGFLPSVMVGLATGLAKPCMGSTIAMRRETLDAIGGFERFRDLLADDNAIGMAVRELGLQVVVPAPIVTHSCTETSLAALAAHELRWNATVRMLDPAGYAGSIVTYPLVWGLIAWIAGACWWVPFVALLARLALAERIDVITGRRTAPLWWLPARDLLSFGLYVGAFFTRRVDWRGAQLHMARDGRMTAEPETRYP
ncbi:bacteriohopanetetrol glucosamine biosynthesis glycosyltransferase HpnI [Sphingomonas oryzagri]|uniref:Bacteriohopanetetrol glucosamine biosynthesis glycosyltransferase HpnI n=1 Tax=Sphingomonas oryzagri TaxID=3042314 RepID=A0ABT6N3E1_9SPHN|nr:bacteriohopanetetrol glucosamine biosynthesis glycosyltransferase HpnI [Sphingomonas oryzagri]MDH7639794.1 bacteriohopanetetrol glucosamine biosynthesis glycosyltransferase HpnI [Sphingomonas oryzagri]